MGNMQRRKGIKMEFGMPVLIENHTLEENMALCERLGLSFLELNMNLPEYQAHKLLEAADYFMEISEKYGIYYTIHMDENLNPCDFNPFVSQAYFDTVKTTIRAAKYLKAPIINMHLNQGVYFTLPNERVYLFQRYCEKYRTSMEKFLRMCEEELENTGIKMCIENTDGYMEYEKEILLQMIKSPVFWLTWDIGHSYGALQSDEDFLLENREKLAHFHIHDGIGKRNHLTLGSGEINLEERLKLARERNARCVIETKTIDALTQSVLWLERVWNLHEEKNNGLFTEHRKISSCK